MDYSTLTNEQLQGQIVTLEEKYQKMRTLALKVAKEMDSLAEQYQLIKKEINKRNGKYQWHRTTHHWWYWGRWSR